jgi:hypothetical protein
MLQSTRLLSIVIATLLLTSLGPGHTSAAPSPQAQKPDTLTLYLLPCRVNVNGNWGKVRASRGLKTDQELLALLWNEGVKHPDHVGKIDLTITPANNGTKFRSYGVCESKDILAARDGEIKEIGNKPSNGNYIVIRHDGGQETWYAHLASLAPLKAGDRVRAGDVIGMMGNTGPTDGFVHLHFSVDNTPVGTWKFVKDVYRIVSVPTGLAVDVNGGSSGNGTAIIQWTWSGTSNQKWVFEPAGDGFVYIRSLKSSKCLDVSEGAGHNGANIIQYTCQSSPNQQWRLAIGAQTTVQVRHTGKLLDAPSRDGGVTLVQWDGNGGANQQWRVEPAN